MDVPRIDRSLGELFSDLSQQTAELIRQEMRLAKAELSEKAADAGRHAMMIGAGVAFGLAAVVTLAAALTLVLIEVGVDGVARRGHRRDCHGRHRLHARAVGHHRVEEPIDRPRRDDAFPEGDDPVAQEPFDPLTPMRQLARASETAARSKARSSGPASR